MHTRRRSELVKKYHNKAGKKGVDHQDQKNHLFLACVHCKLFIISHMINNQEPIVRNKENRSKLKD